MSRRILYAVVSVFALVGGMVTPAVAAPSAPQSFVVVLHPGKANVPSVAADLARGVGGELGFVYEHSIQGFSMTASPAAAAALARNPRVAYVEADRDFSISGQTIPTGITRIFADTNSAIDINSTDDWRVDVDVAVIDTGVDWEHPDLNVVDGINCASGSAFRAKCSGNGDDDHYHGTHVAGSIAAIDNGVGVVGVAPGARIHAVKVLDSQGSGYTSWIVAGIDWVAARANTIEVANMSLGGSGFSQAQYDAIQKAVNKGIAFAVAAGNSDADTSGFSPGGFDNVLSVSALADFDGAPDRLGSPTCRTDQDDTLADFSNWGGAVDIAAPGVCILSTYPIEKGEYGTISGTSMASPHVAGALALLASNTFPRTESGVRDLYADVVEAGNVNWTDDSRDGVQEPLLDVSKATLFNPTLVAGSGGGEPANAAPTASFTQSCTDLTCTFDSTSKDTDGSVVSYAWNYGDGASGSAATSSHTYDVDGTYSVALTVTDNGGASASTSRTVTVTAPDDGGDGLILTGSSSSQGSTWTAIVTSSGSTESLDGTWWYSGGMSTCPMTTECRLSGIPKKQGSVTFTAGSGESITISKP